MGGVSATAQNTSAKMENCVNYADVTVNIDSANTDNARINGYVGGLTGFDAQDTLDYCANYGSVTVTGSVAHNCYLCIGGLVGNLALEDAAWGCYSAKGVSAAITTANANNKLVGAFAGYIDNETKACFAYAEAPFYGGKGSWGSVAYCYILGTETGSENEANAVKTLSAADFAADELVTKLNDQLPEPTFVAGTEYPVFTWLAESTGPISDPVAQVYGFTLTLKGQIGVNAYLCLAENVLNHPDDYQVEFWNGETLASATKASDAGTPRTEVYNGDTYTVYPFSFTTVPKEMSTVFTMKIKQLSTDEYVSFADQSGKTVTSLERTVNAYLDDRLLNSQNQAMQDLAKAMKDYGAFAKHYFDARNGGASEPLPEIEGFEPVSASVLPEITSPEDIDHFQYVGSTLVLESETSFRLYFKSDNVKALTITEASKGQLKIREGQGANADKYYVQISNIAAKDLNAMYTFTISNGETDTTAVHGPFGYVRWALEKGSDNLKYLVSALYYYNQKAAAYFSAVD